MPQEVLQRQHSTVVSVPMPQTKRLQPHMLIRVRDKKGGKLDNTNWFSRRIMQREGRGMQSN